VRSTTQRRGRTAKSTAFGCPPDNFGVLTAEFDKSSVQLVPDISAIAEQVTQPRKEVVDGCNNKRRAIAVLHIGVVDLDTCQQADCVGEDMRLAIFDFLRCIEAARATGLGGLDRLAVDNAGRGAWHMSGRFARLQQQLEIDPLQRTAIAPSVK
jgi:hypothetical protein